MKTFVDSIASYSGPGALLTLLTIWFYISIKKQKFSFFEYMIYFPALFKEYKELTIKEHGRIGWLYYLFIVLVIVTFMSILSSAG